MTESQKILREFTEAAPRVGHMVEPFKDVPEPPEDMNQYAAEYFYKLSHHLHKKGILNKLKLIYIDSICRDLSKMLHDEYYFEPWKDPKQARAGFWIEALCEKYGESLDDLKDREQRMAKETIEVHAGECLDMKLNDLEKIGIPVNRLL